MTTTAARASSTALTSPSTTSLLRPASTRRRPVNEGSNINLSLSDVVDPGTADTHQYRFKCGAGDWTAYGASASHACPTTDNGTVMVKGQVRDDDGGESVEYSADVTVNNVAPSASFNAPAESTRARTSTSPSPTSSIRARPTRTSTASSAAPATGLPTAASASHACPTTDNGTVMVKGQVRDDDGGESVEYSADVTVNNVAPTVNLSGPDTANEGDSKTYTFTVTDPGADTFSFVSRAADGLSHLRRVRRACWDYRLVAGGSFQCRFPDGPTRRTSPSRSRTMIGGISSPDTEQVDIIPVAIANVAPTVTAPANQSSDEGESKSFNLGSFSDPGPDSPWARGRQLGRRLGPHGLHRNGRGARARRRRSLPSPTPTATTARTPSRSRSPIRTTTSDSKTFTVTVANKAPTASNPSFTFDPVFGTATAGFDFSDVGWLDTHGPSLSFFTWSDVGNRSASVTEENIAPNSTGHASDTRTLSPGCYNLTVTGTAKDDDGGMSAALPIYSNSATSVYGRGFRPPIMDNERNIAKYGNVVPVKVVLTNTCTGATVTNVPLYITLHQGTGGEVIEDTVVDRRERQRGRFGLADADGRRDVHLQPVDEVAVRRTRTMTIRIRPFSTTHRGSSQAVLYPKK